MTTPTAQVLQCWNPDDRRSWDQPDRAQNSNKISLPSRSLINHKVPNAILRLQSSNGDLRATVYTAFGDLHDYALNNMSSFSLDKGTTVIQSSNQPYGQTKKAYDAGMEYLDWKIAQIADLPNFQVTYRTEVNVEPFFKPGKVLALRDYASPASDTNGRPEDRFSLIVLTPDYFPGRECPTACPTTLNSAGCWTDYDLDHRRLTDGYPQE